MDYFNVSPRVRRAMHAVPRDIFLPASSRPQAGEDTALPIGCGQTISQPTLVAYMTDQLALTATSRVLEIGTGSGYQTAILAELAGVVFTIERVRELADAVPPRLAGLGYANVKFRLGDGALGWREESPFDAVIVTAAARQLPPALVAQLRPGGRLVAPVGPMGEQVLVRVDKQHDGRCRQTELGGVRFVPLV